MAGKHSHHSRTWWIVILVAAAVVMAIGAIVWMETRTDSDITVQREAMRQASRARLRTKTFMDAAQAGDIKKMTEMLKTDPTLVSAKDSDGASVLHLAAFNNQTAAVDLLLDHGALIDMKGPYGPPLEWAVYAGSDSTVQLLLQRGAKPTAAMLATAEQGARGAIHSSAHIPHTQYDRIAAMLLEAGIKPTSAANFISRLNDPNLPLASVATPIGGEWRADFLKKINTGANLLPSAVAICATAHRTPQGITLSDPEAYTGLLTPIAYASPLEIDIDAMTNGTDLHLYYGPSEVTFNYGYFLTELFLLDPVRGKNIRVANEGQIPAKRFVKIKWIFTNKLMEIFVDGQSHYHNNGDYSHLRGRIGIGPALHSIITVASIRVKSLQTATTKGTQ